MNTSSSTQPMPITRAKASLLMPGITNAAASPIAAMSAAMLMVLATSRDSTRIARSQAGNTRFTLAARPWPVTRPIRATIDWIAASSG